MPTRGSLTLFRVRGIPIRAHWTLLLILPYFAWMFAARFADVARTAGVAPEHVVLHPLVWGLLLAIGLFSSILLHELAHSLLALRTGGRVREITLMLLGGVSQMENIPRKPATEFWIAAVGPLTSLALAGLLWLGHQLLPHGPMDPRLGLYYLAQTNLALGLFNLLPAFPMDGGRVLRATLAGRLGPVRATAIAARIGQVLSGGLAVVGLLSRNYLLMLIALFLYSGAQSEAAIERAKADLEGIRVGELLMARPPTLPVDAPLAQVLPFLRQAGRWETIVTGAGGEPAGVVRALDVAALAPEEIEGKPVGDLGARLTAQVVMVSADAPAADVLAHESAAIVVVARDHEGRLEWLGLLGRSDVRNALALGAIRRRGQGKRPPVAMNRAAAPR